MRALDDVAYSTMARLMPADPSKEVVVVSIDDKSYGHTGDEPPAVTFAGKSPLDPKLLTRIISAILDAQPAALGVDIDTSGWKVRRSDPRIVWGLLDKEPHEGEAQSPLTIHSAHLELPMESGRVLNYPVARRVGEDLRPPLALALVRIYCGYAPAKCKDAELEPDAEERLRSVKRAQGSASEPDFLTLSARNLVAGEAHPEALRQLLKDKIVLLGGTAEDLGDRHLAAFGLESGLGIHAEIVSSLLSHRIQGNWAAGAELFISVVFLALFEVLVNQADRALRHRNAATKALIPLGILLLVLSGQVVFMAWAATTVFAVSGIYFGFFSMVMALFLHDSISTHLEHVLAEAHEAHAALNRDQASD